MSETYKPHALSVNLLTSAAKLADAAVPLGNKPLALATLRDDLFRLADVRDAAAGMSRNVAAAMFMCWHAERVASGPAGETPSMHACIGGLHDSKPTAAGAALFAAFVSDVLPTISAGDTLAERQQRNRRGMLSLGMVDACVWALLGVTLSDYLPDARTFAVPLSHFVPYGHDALTVVDGGHSRNARTVMTKAHEKLSNRVPVGVGLVLKCERAEDAPESLKLVPLVNLDAADLVVQHITKRAIMATGTSTEATATANKGATMTGQKKPGAQASSPAKPAEAASAAVNGTPAAGTARKPRMAGSNKPAAGDAGPAMVFATLPAMLPEVITLLATIDSSESGIRAAMADKDVWSRITECERICRDIRNKAVAIAKRDSAKPSNAKPDAKASDTKAA